MDLPPADHAYGKKTKGDGETAGAILGGWVEHQ